LSEYREVPLDLREAGKITQDQLKILLAGIATFLLEAEITYPHKRISICRDEEDNMILECCMAARADYLITGDKDLLEIDSKALKRVGLKSLRILNPRAFLSKSKSVGVFRRTT
jgi:predicted nucleic acid-binding protein